MILHTAAIYWRTIDIHTFEWQVLNFWHGSLFRWGVPVFTMISGALFLSRDIPFKKIYGKYVLRILAAFMFWAVIYTCGYYAVNRDSAKAVELLFKGGSYHLWFLPMIIGLYMIQPFLKKIAESELLTKYFLVLVIIFTFVIPEAVSLISLLSERSGELIGGFVNMFKFDFVAGFTGYFLMGYFLNNLKITPKVKRLIYALGIFALLWGQLLSITASSMTGEANHVFYKPISMCGLCLSMAVFIFFREKFNRPSQSLKTLAKYTFGAYLVHASILSIFKKTGFTPLTFSPVISVLVLAVLVFILSFAVSAALNHIPVLKKYIV